MIKKIFLLCAILITCSSCSEFALLASGSSLAISQNAYAKAYNGIDILTIMQTDKDIKRHIYDKVRERWSRSFRFNASDWWTAKKEIETLKETLKSRDYTRQHDYQFLIDENHRLEQQYLEVMADNKKLSYQIEDQVNRLRKAGMWKQ